MKFRHVVVSSLAILALAATAGLHLAAVPASGLTGTVKATGLSSNSDAIVYVVQVAGTFTPPAPVTMNQKQMQFIPHVLPALIGTTVKFLNSDPTAHNVFTGDYEKFNLGTWPQGQTKDHVFNTCAKFPCAYTTLCRVHAEMEGYVVVLQNPYFAVSAKDGHYAIPNLPAGKYDVAVWHPKLKGKVASVTVTAGAAATLDFVLSK